MKIKLAWFEKVTKGSPQEEGKEASLNVGRYREIKGRET